MIRTVLALCLMFSVMFTASSAWAADYSGTWVLDLKSSDSLEPLLKAQGANMMMRRAADRLVVTQTITQDDNQVTVKNESSFRTNTDVLQVDGETRTVEGDRGEVQTRHSWEGEVLVSNMTMPMAKGQGTMNVRRILSEDGATLTQRITVNTPAGETHVINRVFKRQ
ncbi:MAG: lipocalin/fatty-acid binding family protein [Myxococcota bacterium]